jgi:hypothetical protein
LWAGEPETAAELHDIVKLCSFGLLAHPPPVVTFRLTAVSGCQPSVAGAASSAELYETVEVLADGILRRAASWQTPGGGTGQRRDVRPLWGGVGPLPRHLQ